MEVSKKVKHGLVPQGASKLQDVQVWSKNLKIWHPVTLVPLEVQGRVLPFWKPLINIFKEPDCHGCCSALNVSQAMLKIVFLLVSYYKRLKTNAKDCIKLRSYLTPWRCNSFKGFMIGSAEVTFYHELVKKVEKIDFWGLIVDFI